VGGQLTGEGRWGCEGRGTSEERGVRAKEAREADTIESEGGEGADGGTWRRRRGQQEGVRGTGVGAGELKGGGGSGAGATVRG